MRHPLKKRYSVLAADPPWPFGDKLPSKSGESRGAERKYKVLTIPEICNFRLPPLEDDALCFLWRVAAMQEEALAVMRAWGFTPKSEVVWVKQAKVGGLVLAMGMGRYVRHSHEVCLIGTRNNGLRLVKDHGVRSVIFAPRGEHSAKPDAFYQLVDRLCEGPKVELFARRQWPGWICLGNEMKR